MLFNSELASILHELHDHEDRIEVLQVSGVIVGTPLTGNIVAGNNNIINLSLPVNDNDAVPIITLK